MTRKNAFRGLTTTESGFSLVEMMVALVILTVGVLGMALVTAFTVQNVTAAELATERSQALQSVVEQLRSMPFDSLANGADTVGVFEVSWSVVDNGTYTTLTIVTVGPGLAPGTGASAMSTLSGEVADTFDYVVTDS